MEADLFSRLAQSQNVALAFSIALNGVLGRSLIKLYHSKEELHKKLVELLREIIPIAVQLKDKVDSLE